MARNKPKRDWLVVLRPRMAALALLLALCLWPAATPGARSASGPVLQGGFADFWRGHDGALLFGAPLTEERREGKLTVQYFERARLEWHPDYPPGEQITLARLGAEQAGRAFPGIASFPPNPGHLYFAATGHSVQGDLLRFWREEGGLPIFGYPISEELTEDGLTVQYFERARLEHHPELATLGYRVLPSPLGATSLRSTSSAAVVMEPPAVQEGHTVLIKLLSPPGGTLIGGTLNDHKLSFNCCLPLAPGGGRAYLWAVAGAEPYQSPDSLPLTVSLRAADGTPLTVTRNLSVVPYPFPTRRDVYYGPRTPPNVRTTEHAILDAVFAGRSGPPLRHGPFLPPLHGPLVETAPFGERRAYNDEPPYEVHWGWDLTAGEGTPVYAPAAGRVVFARWLILRGNAIVLDHGAGVFTLYAHLSAYRVTVGQVVAPGTLIGLSGHTGNVTGPHLHWEVHVAGPPVAPQEWLAPRFPP
ncbi:MAG: M23 family metallopeptidase [Chloroflexia bacterium]